ncbi:MAG: hypothetical protein ACLQOO_11170 [Terriglobia bacterium]
MNGSVRSQTLGAVVGKALEPLPKGAGLIQVLVTRQQSVAIPEGEEE